MSQAGNSWTSSSSSSSSMSGATTQPDLGDHLERRTVTFPVPSKAVTMIGLLVAGLLFVTFIAQSYQYENFTDANLWVGYIKMALPILGAGFALYGAVHADQRYREQRDDRLRAERLGIEAAKQHAETEARAYKLQKKRQYQAMINRTFETLRQLDDLGGIEHRIEISDRMEAAVEKDEVNVAEAGSVDAFLASSGLRQKVGKTLGRFEDLALAVKYGHVDEHLVYDSMRLVVANFYKWFGVWMNDAHFKDDVAYEEILALAKAWAAGRCLSADEPLAVDDARARARRAIDPRASSSAEGRIADVVGGQPG